MALLRLHEIVYVRLGRPWVAYKAGLRPAPTRVVVTLLGSERGLLSRLARYVFVQPFRVSGRDGPDTSKRLFNSNGSLLRSYNSH